MGGLRSKWVRSSPYLRPVGRQEKSTFSHSFDSAKRRLWYLHSYAAIAAYLQLNVGHFFGSAAFHTPQATAIVRTTFSRNVLESWP